MLTENDIKEELSYAYVHAVASRAGFGCDRPGKDRDSIDVVISARGRLAPDSVLYSPRLDLQLKSTSAVLPDIEEFPFELELKNYHDLRCRSAVPRVLVVLSLPSNPDEWLEHTGEGLITRRCAYWHNLAGAPETENQRSRTVRISRRNALSPASLTALMRKVSRQEEIGHAL